MGTLVSIHVVPGEADSAALEAAVDRAFRWFHVMETCCTRFDSRSELRLLCAHAGRAVQVSPMLFEAVRFAVLVAEETDGAFDPTVGHRMEERGFNREYHTGQILSAPVSQDAGATFRDVELDPAGHTITLRRALTLDLGAVAKGLAVDTAAKELEPFVNFAIDAGGDLYLGGANEHGMPWSVGVRHPRRDRELIDWLRVSNQAVCTSGDYEKDAPHILDPRNGAAAASVASATVVAPGALLADALATAAFVLGPAEGIRLLERMGVQGLILTPSLERFETEGLCHAA